VQLKCHSFPLCAPLGTVPCAAEACRAQGGLQGAPMEAEDEDVCRICREPATDESPLRCPCACAGSIKHVHQECLLEWLKVWPLSLSLSRAGPLTPKTLHLSPSELSPSRAGDG
jgi:hypothetical protein